ncbi:MAG: hypothetical protein RIS80_841 [Actinomycetota bacterium]
MSHAFGNIAQLVVGGRVGSGELEIIENAGLVVDAGLVVWVGPNSQLPPADRFTDLAGRTVIPGFVDSHAHLVFAGDRAAEFEARMSGVSYSAGGIKTTVAATRAASDDELRAGLNGRMRELHRSGITTFETKSGYGLNVFDEARSLRLAAEVSSLRLRLRRLRSPLRSRLAMLTVRSPPTSRSRTRLSTPTRQTRFCRRVFEWGFGRASTPTNSRPVLASSWP